MAFHEPETQCCNKAILLVIATALRTPGVHVLLAQTVFVDLLIGAVGLKDLLFSDDLSFEGSKLDLISFLTMPDKPQGTFSIVTP